MDIDEASRVRREFLDECLDENGFIYEQNVLYNIMPYLLDAKLVDSEDFSDCFFSNSKDKYKLNGYSINESGERLQVFQVSEDKIKRRLSDDELYISNKSDYDGEFNKSIRLVKQCIKGAIIDDIQDSDPLATLSSFLGSPEGVHQIDVVEVFVISLTVSATRKTATLQPRQIHFENEYIDVMFSGPNGKEEKEVLLLRQVIDINFIFNILSSRGNRNPLLVNFKKTFGREIPVIEAADEKNFSSYLCVLDANIIADLYRQYSSRLLEKNVRSFLQFKGVNRGIRDTIRSEPEKFIAYNNGLTLTATAAKVNIRKKIAYIESLQDLQIVNGGQTTASIYFSKKDGLDVSSVKVMAKINVVTSDDENELDDLISNISRYSNTQSKVSNVDLRSRNKQLVKLKQLSDSVVTPTGKKWFFERSKGEFNTRVRLAGSSSSRIKNEYPPARRFSKEQLAKYYCSWGGSPHLVKKGGEKIFRIFIEEISNEEGDSAVSVDREFYESLIAKIIIFRAFEKIYGSRKSAIGQLRSAVIPYAMSLIYMQAIRLGREFNFLKVWRDEGLSQEMEAFAKSLMVLVNNLIKKYSLSDDFGEYSKKEELWESIESSKEIESFFNSADAEKLLASYFL